MHRDRIVGVLTTILGAAVAYMTSQLAGTNMPGDPGPKVFPYICAGILLVCGLILTIRKPAGEAKPFLNGKEEVKRFISIILVIAAYIVLMWLLRLPGPTLLVVCLLCFMSAEGKNIPKWQPIVYSIIVTRCAVCGIRLYAQAAPAGRYAAGYQSVRRAKNNG